MGRRLTIVDVHEGETEDQAMARAEAGEPEFQLQEKELEEKGLEVESAWDPAPAGEAEAAAGDLASEWDELRDTPPLTPEEEKAAGLEGLEDSLLEERADAAAHAAIEEGQAKVAEDVAAFDEANPKKRKGARGRVGKKELKELATSATYSPRVEDERQVDLEQAIQAKALTDEEEGAKAKEVLDGAMDEERVTHGELEPLPLTPERVARAVDEVKRMEGPALLGIDQLHESPTNPRRTHPPMDSLLESVKRSGILQPLLVRPSAQGFEIVAGHRRFRAAQAAGLKAIPVTVRNLSDDETLEAQLAENLHRADVHALEEAEAYERLMKLHGRNADAIAERLSLSRSYVYGRLKLLALGEPGRKVFLEGKLDPSSALLIARIPLALQEKALKEVLQPTASGEVMSFRALRDHVQNHYMLRLTEAPFDPKDAMLVAERGACGPCPERTGNAGELFGDVGRGDVCTNPVCFQRKVSAHWMEAKERAGQKGHAILPQAEGRKLYQSGTLAWNSGWVELNAPAPDDKEKRTWRKLLGKAKLPITIAMDGKGHIHEMAPKAEALSVLAGEGVRWAQTAEAVEVQTEPLTGADLEAAKLEADIKALTVRNVMSQAVGHLERKGLDVPALRAMVLGLMHVNSPAFVMERRGFATEDGLHTWVTRKADVKGLLGLAFELAVAEWIGGGAGSIQAPLIAVAKATGVDIRATEKAVKTELMKSRLSAEAESLFSQEEMAGKEKAVKESPVKAKPAAPRKAKLQAARAEVQKAVRKIRSLGKVKPKVKPKAKAAGKAKASRR